MDCDLVLIDLALQGGGSQAIGRRIS